MFELHSDGKQLIQSELLQQELRLTVPRQVLFVGLFNQRSSVIRLLIVVLKLRKTQR